MTTTPIFKATYRLIGFCFLIGIAGGFAALGFDWAVHLAQGTFLQGLAGYRPPDPQAIASGGVAPTVATRLWIPLVTTLGGLLSGWIVYRWAPETEGHGTDAAVAAYHQRGGAVRHRVPFVKGLASALTIGSGGVAGKEGPTAQISVGLGAILSEWLGLRGQERRVLLLAGMAAGLAAVFRAPLGMAIFAVEILYSGMVFESEALIYTVVAAVSAYAVHGVFAGWSHVFTIPEGLAFEHPLTLASFAALGILAGVLGAVLPQVFYRTRDLFRRLPGPPHLKPALGGLLVGLGAMALPEILGTGYGWVQLAIAEKLPLATVLLLLLLKGPGMAITIGSGGSGGVFAPTVVIGAMLGSLVGTVTHTLAPAVDMPTAAFVVAGMAAVFAGAARTPISTLIMVAEMTGGYGLIVPTMLANILAFLVQRSLTLGSRYPTLYEAQVETREDSPLHRGVFVRRAIEMLERGHVEASELTLPRLVSLLRFGEPVPITHRWQLVSVTIEPGSAFAGRTVAETVGGLSGTTAVAVFHGDEMLVARGPTRLEPGDQLLAVTLPESHEFLLAFAKGSKEAESSTPD